MLVSAIETYSIVKVGALLGTGATLAIIVLTAIVGAKLASKQGLAVVQQLSAAMRSGEGVGTALVEGVLVFAAAVTLLAPGFLTDAAGIALLLPPIRRALARPLARALARRVSVVSPMVQGGPRSGSRQDSGDEDRSGAGIIDV